MHGALGGYVSEGEREREGGGILLWMVEEGSRQGLRRGKGDGDGGLPYCIPSRINDAFDAPANSLEGVRANDRSSLRDALDSLAGFGR